MYSVANVEEENNTKLGLHSLQRKSSSPRTRKISDPRKSTSEHRNSQTSTTRSSPKSQISLSSRSEMLQENDSPPSSENRMVPCNTCGKFVNELSMLKGPKDKCSVYKRALEVSTDEFFLLSSNNGKL